MSTPPHALEAGSGGATPPAPPDRRPLIDGISWMLLEKLLRVASGLLISTLVARHLGPADYGALAIAMAAIGLAAAAANLGADHINQTELGRASGPEFLASAFAVRLLWAAVCAGAAWLLARQFDPAAAPLYAALTASVVATAPQVFTHQLYADSRFRTASLLGVAVLVIVSALRLLGVHQGHGTEWFAWCFSAEMLLLSLGAMACVAGGRTRRWQPLAATRQQMLTYARLCAPTMASAVLVALYFRVELFVVGGLLGSVAAGTWAGAMMFILPWNMASAAVLPVVNRRLSQRAEGSADAQRTDMVRLVRAMALLALGAAVFNMAVVHWVLPLLLGPRYAAAMQVATVCSLALVPLFMGAAQDVWLARQRRTGVVLRKVLLGLPLTLALLTLGAWQGGLQGVAMAMVVSYLTTAVLLNAWLDRDHFHIQLQALGIRRD